MNASENPDSDQTLQRLLAACLESLELGEAIDRDQLRRDHPQYVDSICEFLDNNGLVVDAIDGLRKGEEKSVVDTVFAPTLDSRWPNPSKKFEIGETLRYIGEYEIVDEIARGGMGIVFRARQSHLRRDVALKMILSGRLASDADVDRFHREAQAAAALKHPNIVGVHEIGQHEGHHYFTMDLVDGRSLASIISEETLSPRTAAELIKTVALAIEYAHGHGVLHRDLKPANILIDGSGQPHVTDFGLAKTMSEDALSVDLTATGQILGTPSYMSPEQASAKHSIVSVASDVYSLGAILYACLTGRGPFVADSAVDTIRQVIEKEPVALRLLNPTVPREMETVCLKCLSKEPHERYGTAQQLAQDLSRFLEGRPVLAQPVSTTSRVWKWTKRNPILTLLLLLLGCSLVGGSAASLSFGVSAKQHARRSERSLYFAQIHMGRDHWNRGHVSRTREILQRASIFSQGTDLRKWEWYWLQTIQHQEELVLNGHVGPVLSLDLDQARQSLVSGGADGSIRIWDPHIGFEIFRLAQLNGSVNSVAWHPEKPLIASGGGDGVIRVWDIEKRRKVDENSGQTDEVLVLQWSLNGRLLASGGSNGKVDVWEVRDEKLLHLRTLPAVRSPVRSLAWQENDTTLLVGFGGHNSGQQVDLAVWEVSLSELKNRRYHNLATDAPLRSMVIQNDLGLLAVTAANGRVRIYDSQTFAEISNFSDSKYVNCLAWNNDTERPKLAAAGDSSVIRIYDHQTRSVPTILWGHQQPVNAVAWLSTTRLASASDDGTIRFWDIEYDDEATEVISAENFVSDVSWSPNGEKVAIASLLTEATVWDTTTRKTSLKLVGHSARIWSIDWHPSGLWIATTGIDKTLRIWDARTGRETAMVEGNSAGNSLEWSPDGTRIAIKMHDVFIWNFDVDSGELLEQVVSYPGPKNFALSDISWHPDGQLIASPRDNEGLTTVEVWNPLNAETLKTFSIGGNKVRSLAWSPDGELMALGTEDGRLELWRPLKKQKVFSLQAHEQELAGIAWSPDGERLATTGWEGTVKVRNSSDGEELITFQDSLGQCEPVEWSPDGLKLAAGNWASGHNKVRIWDASVGYKLHANGRLKTVATKNVARNQRLRNEKRLVYQELHEFADQVQETQAKSGSALFDQFLSFCNDHFQQFSPQYVFQIPELLPLTDTPDFEKVITNQFNPDVKTVTQSVWLKRKKPVRWRHSRATFESMQLQSAKQKRSGLQPTFLSVEQMDRSQSPLCTVVWQATGHAGQIEIGMNQSQLKRKLESVDDNLGISAIEEYVEDGETRYAVLWSTQFPASTVLQRNSYDQTAERAEEFVKSSRWPIYVNCHDDGTLTTIWAAGEHSSRLLTGLSQVQLLSLKKEISVSEIPTCVDSYFDGSRRRYSVILQDSDAAYDWSFTTLIPNGEFQTTFDSMNQRGWMCVCTTGSPLIRTRGQHSATE